MFIRGTAAEKVTVNGNEVTLRTQTAPDDIGPGYLEETVTLDEVISEAEAAERFEELWELASAPPESTDVSGDYSDFISGLMEGLSND